jgi:uncharacterized protein (TIGR03435 family)
MRLRFGGSGFLFAAVALVSVSALLLMPEMHAQGADTAIPPARIGFTDAFAEMPSIKFDIISFKRCPDDTQGRGSRTQPANADFIAFHCQSVHNIIYFAYTTADHPFLLSGQPDWVETDHYDLQAKVAAEDVEAYRNLNVASRRMMVRGLLADELKLKMHLDTTPHAVYDLVIGKGELKVTPYKEGETVTLPNGQVVVQPTGLEMAPDGQASYHGITMVQLAEAIAVRVDRQVIDKTNLAGRYDLKTFMPGAHYSPSMENAEDSPIPKIFDGVKALGLSLVSAKEATGGLVVDHIERPTEN